MRSSGMLVTERVEHKECDGTVTHSFPLFSEGEKFTQSWPCEFAGDTDVLIDYETGFAFWSCPRCGAEHDVSGEVFQ